MDFGDQCGQGEGNYTSYGLVIGGEAHISNIHVHGSVYVRPDTDVRQIDVLDAGCSVITSTGTGAFDFDTINENFLYASKKLSELPPTLHLDKDNRLTRIGTNDLGHDVITFDTCVGGCSSDAQLSEDDVIFQFIGNWNGAVGMQWPEKLIINVRRSFYYRTIIYNAKYLHRCQLVLVTDTL